MNNTAKLQAIDAIYAALPRMECKGLCQACCTTFGMTGLEKKRIEAVVGQFKTKRVMVRAEASKHIPGLPGPRLGIHDVLECKVCPFLKEGRCSVYDIRPAICRMWGLTMQTKCQHGCQPERYLTEQEAFEFMSTVQRLSQ